MTQHQRPADSSPAAETTLACPVCGRAITLPSLLLRMLTSRRGPVCVHCLIGQGVLVGLEIVSHRKESVN